MKLLTKEAHGKIFAVFVELTGGASRYSWRIEVKEAGRKTVHITPEVSAPSEFPAAALDAMAALDRVIERTDKRKH